VSALIVGTICLELEEGDTCIGVDAHDDADRVDVLLPGGRILALTRYEAERLGDYLKLACSRGPRADR
jgi:hypothetical protein